MGEITRDTSGSGGALLFAANSIPGITRVTISGTDDFAVARIRVGILSVPEAGTLGSLAIIVAVGALLLRRSRARRYGSEIRESAV